MKEGRKFNLPLLITPKKATKRAISEQGKETTIISFNPGATQQKRSLGMHIPKLVLCVEYFHLKEKERHSRHDKTDEAM